MGQNPYNNDFPSPDYQHNPYYNPANPAPQPQNPYASADPSPSDPYHHSEYSAYRNEERNSPYQRDGMYAYGQYQQRMNTTPITTMPTRNTSTIALSILLYLWATLCGFLGITGFTQGVAPSIPDGVLGVILLAQILLGLVLLVIVLIKHKQPRLRWWVRLLYTLGASVLGFIAAIIAVGISDPANLGTNHNPFENYVLGSVFLVYYVIVAVIALY